MKSNMKVIFKDGFFSSLPPDRAAAVEKEIIKEVLSMKRIDLHHHLNDRESLTISDPCGYDASWLFDVEKIDFIADEVVIGNLWYAKQYFHFFHCF